MTIRPNSDAKRPREAEISQFHCAIMAHENIGWLHVSVENSVLVANLNASQDLVKGLFYLIRRHMGRRHLSPLNHLLQKVSFAEFEYQVEFVKMGYDVY